FDLDRIIDLALERNPTILGAQSVIEQNEGRRTEAGAYPNPTIGAQTANAAIRDPSNGVRFYEYGVTVHQPVEWPGMRAARQDAAASGLAGATVGLEETKLNLIAEVKQAFYELLLAERTVDLLQQNLEIVQEVARIVRARVRSGEGPQFEAVKADVEVLKAKQEMTKAKNAVRVKLVGVDTLTAGAQGPRYKGEGDFRSLRARLEAELIRARNDLARAINQHAREAETAQEQILVYEEGLLKQAQEALRIAQLSFRQGASSLLDVLDAQRVQRQITVDYNLARFELSLALTRFERAVGGPL